jgi:hypothetical protein
MTESEERYSKLPYVLRAYAERAVLSNWSSATDEHRFKAQKLAFAIDQFTKSALKSLLGNQLKD